MNPSTSNSRHRPRMDSYDRLFNLLDLEDRDAVYISSKRSNKDFEDYFFKQNPEFKPLLQHAESTGSTDIHIQSFSCSKNFLQLRSGRYGRDYLVLTRL